MLLAIVLASCASEPAADLAEDDLVVANAYDVQKRSVSEGNVEQLTYKVRLEFPHHAIGAKRVAMLKERGWNECSTAPAWEGFIDAATQPARLVHQSQKVFVKGDQLVVAAMFYSSAPQGGTRSKPDNNEQHVVVMKYNLRNEEVKEQMASVFPQCIK